MCFNDVMRFLQDGGCTLLDILLRGLIEFPTLFLHKSLHRTRRNLCLEFVAADIRELCLGEDIDAIDLPF